MPEGETVGQEQVVLQQNIKARVEGRDVVAVNVFGDEATVLVPESPGEPVEWIPVSTGSELMIGSQRFVVTSVTGTAGDLPEGQACGQVVLRSIAS